MVAGFNYAFFRLCRQIHINLVDTVVFMTVQKDLTHLYSPFTFLQNRLMVLEGF